MMLKWQKRVWTRAIAFNQSEHGHIDALRRQFFAFISAESQRLLACMSRTSFNTASSSSDSIAASEAEAAGSQDIGGAQCLALNEILIIRLDPSVPQGGVIWGGSR